MSGLPHGKGDAYRNFRFTLVRFGLWECKRSKCETGFLRSHEIDFCRNWEIPG